MEKDRQIENSGDGNIRYKENNEKGGKSKKLRMIGDGTRTKSKWVKIEKRQNISKKITNYNELYISERAEQ